MENKKQNVLDVLIKLSNLEFQKDVWVSHKYWDRVLNYGEAVNTLGDYYFFDDLDKINFLGHEKIKVKKFVHKLLDYNDVDISAEEMLQDKKWLEIVKDAKEAHDILEKYQWG